jgi:hypothetical protein
LRYARLRGLKRRMILLPGLPVPFMAFGVGLVTPVPYPIAYALIGGLSADSVVKHAEALQVFPEVRLIDFDSAAKAALDKTHPVHIERVWDDGRGAFKIIKHEGCFIHQEERQVAAEPEKILTTLKQIVNTSDAFVKVLEANGQLIVCVNDRAAGEQWIEWRLTPKGRSTHLSQTVFFCPHGLPGFLYWSLLYPFHRLNFQALLQKIASTGKRLTTDSRRHGEEN